MERARLPQRPHGSIVLGVESVAGAILMPGSDDAVERFSFRMIEEHEIVTWPLPTATPQEYLLLPRHDILLQWLWVLAVKSTSNRLLATADRSRYRGAGKTR